jgi:protein-tyrosine phosphatase
MTYNFGSVSEKAPAVFGVEAPGVPMKPGGVYNEAGSVPNAVVEEWAAFLKAEGVTRTICLLKAEELACYAAPGYAKILEAQGITPSMVDIFQEGASDAIKAAAGAAKAAGEKVAVHCSGGEGRTGLALGAVLVSECGMTPPDAAAEVVRHSAELGTVRKVKTEKLEALLANGHA